MNTQAREVASEVAGDIAQHAALEQRAEIGQQQVADYLQRNPDFFEKHPQLLTKMQIPHDAGPATVSLVERQVQVLRDKNQSLDGRLREFVDVAKSNDKLIDQMHRLACRLISARGTAQLLDELDVSLLQDFIVTEWMLVLMRHDVPELSRIQHRRLRVTQRGAAELRSFDTFFEAAQPRCGQIRDSQRDYLFGPEANAVGSAALVPLGPNGSYGVLAIGSNDANHFVAGMSTDYLLRIGELISAAVGEL